LLFRLLLKKTDLIVPAGLQGKILPGKGGKTKSLQNKNKYFKKIMSLFPAANAGMGFLMCGKGGSYGWIFSL
jgi:hypothetical protein